MNSPIAQPSVAASEQTTVEGWLRPALSRRHLLIGGLFAGVTIAGAALKPRVVAPRLKPGTIERWMPARIGPWTSADASGVVLPPPDELADRLYDTVVTRVYEAPGREPVMLLLAYSSTQDGMLQVHRPEFCYRAGGFGLGPTTNVEIADARGTQFGANSFVASGQDRVERVLYWTRIGESLPQSWSGQHAAVMKANLHGLVPDGLLARVSCTAPGAAGPLDGLREFVIEFDRAAPPQLHTLLFGAR